MNTFDKVNQDLSELIHVLSLAKDQNKLEQWAALYTETYLLKLRNMA